jgi:hypothetical protein
MSDILSETTLGLAEAARRLPSYRRGSPVSPSTLWRWITDGVKLPGGQMVRLEAARLGGRWLTSVEALARFAAAQTPTFGGGGSPPEPPPAAPTRSRAQRAAEELSKAGI